VARSKRVILFGLRFCDVPVQFWPLLDAKQSTRMSLLGHILLRSLGRNPAPAEAPSGFGDGMGLCAGRLHVCGKRSATAEPGLWHRR